MSTQLLEGSLADIRKGLDSLHLAPDARLQVILDSPKAESATLIDPFVPTEFWNGVPLLPFRASSEPVTLELVKRILEED